MDAPVQYLSKISVLIDLQKRPFDVVELMVTNQFTVKSINLNAKRVNGMTPFDFALHIGNLVKIDVRKVIRYFL